MKKQLNHRKGNLGIINCLLLLAFMCNTIVGQTFYNSDGSVFVPKDFYPDFSWDVAPQYHMFDNVNAVLTTDELNIINDKSSFVTIEKNHARNILGSADAGCKHEATTFHEMNSKNKVLFYFNAAIAYPLTTYTEGFAKEGIDNYPIFKDYLLEVDGVLQGNSWLYYYDVLNPDFRDWWVQTVVTAIDETGTDGVFVDQMHGFSWLHPTEDRGGIDVAQGQLMSALRAAMPSDKILLGNKSHDYPLCWPSADATMFEHYNQESITKESFLRDWQDMLSIAQDNKITVWRLGAGQETDEDVDLEEFSKEKAEFFYAVFLIGAQPYSYIEYAWGWNLYDGPLVDYPELKERLGAPLGAYNRTYENGWEFTREFEYASVWVDTEARTAKITWHTDIQGGDNLALAGTAIQSSTSYNGDASRAIDGDTNGAYSGNSITHTGTEDNAYWQVTLDDTYNIGDINVYGRTDACCVERLSNFTVLVYNESTRNFAEIVSDSPNPFATVNAGGAFGNVIRIRSNTGQALSLAEVEVYEDKNAPIGSTIAFRKYGGDNLWVTAEKTNDDNQLIARGIAASSWEKFLIEEHPDGGIALKSNATGKYIQVQGNSENSPIRAQGEAMRSWEQFEWKSMGDNEMALQSVYTGKWIQASWQENEAILYANGEEAGMWETFTYSIIDSASKTVLINEKIFELYPNPTTDYFQIDSTDIQSVEIYNVSGELVKDFDGSTDMYVIEGLSTGIYLVKTITSDGKLNIDKLIKL